MHRRALPLRLHRKNFQSKQRANIRFVPEGDCGLEVATVLFVLADLSLWYAI